MQQLEVNTAEARDGRTQQRKRKAAAKAAQCDGITISPPGS